MSQQSSYEFLNDGIESAEVQFLFDMSPTSSQVDFWADFESTDIDTFLSVNAGIEGAIGSIVGELSFGEVDQDIIGQDSQATLNDVTNPIDECTEPGRVVTEPSNQSE
jgi:hypothetical protein